MSRVRRAVRFVLGATQTYQLALPGDARFEIELLPPVQKGLYEDGVHESFAQTHGRATFRVRAVLEGFFAVEQPLHPHEVPPERAQARVHRVRQEVRHQVGAVAAHDRPHEAEVVLLRGVRQGVHPVGQHEEARKDSRVKNG